jgi:[ribosomal protein S5]-alanine N-acetyltransferase
MQIKLRLQKVSDAKRFYDILSNPNFKYLNANPKSVADEKKWLRENPSRRKNNTGWNYAILIDGKVFGAIGIMINFHRKHIGEIGFFLDEKYWGKGIVSNAVKLAEEICFKKLKLTRIEIIMQPENIGSKKVAVKNGYLKEGRIKKVVRGRDGKMKDCFLYAKVL